MKRILKNELYRAFINKKFVLTILAEVIMVLVFVCVSVVPIITHTVPYYKTLIGTGKISYMPGAFYTWLGLMNSPVHIMLTAILPLLISIPYGASVYSDEQSNYVYHIEIRTKRKKYYAMKLLTLFLSGGTVAAFPYLLSFLINIALLPMETVFTSTSASLGNIVVLSELFYSNTLMYVFVYIILTFAGFGTLNCLCFVASELFSNRFIVTLFPFSVDFIMYVIGYFFGGRNRTPWLYLNIESMWKTDLSAVFIQFSIVLIIIFATYYYKCFRKVDVL